MTLVRRVSTLEADGDPTERVVRWLTEAQTYGSLEGYMDHVLERSPAELPLNRLPREAIAAIRGRRGPRIRDVEDEIHEMLLHLLFRLHLVFRIIGRSQEFLAVEELKTLLLIAHVGLALDREPDEKPLLSLPQCATCSSCG